MKLFYRFKRTQVDVYFIDECHVTKTVFLTKTRVILSPRMDV